MCNLEPSEKCYGCVYWGTGDMEGCKLTTEFRKNNPNSTDEEYEKFMLSKGRKSVEMIYTLKESNLL